MKTMKTNGDWHSIGLCVYVCVCVRSCEYVCSHMYVTDISGKVFTHSGRIFAGRCICLVGLWGCVGMCVSVWEGRTKTVATVNSHWYWVLPSFAVYFPRMLRANACVCLCLSPPVSNVQISLLVTSHAYDVRCISKFGCISLDNIWIKVSRKQNKPLSKHSTERKGYVMRIVKVMSQFQIRSHKFRLTLIIQEEVQIKSDPTSGLKVLSIINIWVLAEATNLHKKEHTLMVRRNFTQKDLFCYISWSIASYVVI